jgi:hypothetical protein
LDPDSVLEPLTRDAHRKDTRRKRRRSSTMGFETRPFDGSNGENARAGVVAEVKLARELEGGGGARPSFGPASR